MKKSAAKKSAAITGDYTGLVGNISELLESARRTSARAVNAIMTATCWEIGRHIVEFEQDGEKRTEYGKALLVNLSFDLTSRFGRGFARSNLIRFRHFYLAFPGTQIRSTLSNESSITKKRVTLSLEPESPLVSSPAFDERGHADLRDLACSFQLPWSHYMLLARYALEGLPNQTLVCEYRTVLPAEESLAAEIGAARRRLEARKP